jgi:hypothetical protein
MTTSATPPDPASFPTSRALSDRASDSVTVTALQSGTDLVEWPTGRLLSKRAADDRRRVEVSLTQAGRRAYAEAVDMSAAQAGMLDDVVDLPALRDNLLAIITYLAEHPGRSVLR